MARVSLFFAPISYPLCVSRDHFLDRLLSTLMADRLSCAHCYMRTMPCDRGYDTMMKQLEDHPTKGLRSLYS